MVPSLRASAKKPSPIILVAGLLTFDVEVVSVREATNEEISHGHVHAEGGCGHAH